MRFIVAAALGRDLVDKAAEQPPKAVDDPLASFESRLQGVEHSPEGGDPRVQAEAAVLLQVGAGGLSRRGADGLGVLGPLFGSGP